MKQNGSFQETIARIGQKLRSSRKRYFGVLLILLGVALGIVSRAAGGSPFQGFATGILMGLSAASFSLGFLQSCCPSSGESNPDFETVKKFHKIKLRKFNLLFTLP